MASKKLHHLWEGSANQFFTQRGRHATQLNQTSLQASDRVIEMRYTPFEFSRTHGNEYLARFTFCPFCPCETFCRFAAVGGTEEEVRKRLQDKRQDFLKAVMTVWSATTEAS